MANSGYYGIQTAGAAMAGMNAAYNRNIWKLANLQMYERQEIRRDEAIALNESRYQASLVWRGKIFDQTTARYDTQQTRLDESIDLGETRYQATLDYRKSQTERQDKRYKMQDTLQFANLKRSSDANILKWTLARNKLITSSDSSINTSRIAEYESLIQSEKDYLSRLETDLIGDRQSEATISSIGIPVDSVEETVQASDEPIDKFAADKGVLYMKGGGKAGGRDLRLTNIGGEEYFVDVKTQKGSPHMPGYEGEYGPFDAEDFAPITPTDPEIKRSVQEFKNLPEFKESLAATTGSIIAVGREIRKRNNDDIGTEDAIQMSLERMQAKIEEFEGWSKGIHPKVQGVAAQAVTDAINASPDLKSFQKKKLKALMQGKLFKSGVEYAWNKDIDATVKSLIKDESWFDPGEQSISLKYKDRLVKDAVLDITKKYIGTQQLDRDAKKKATAAMTETNEGKTFLAEFFRDTSIEPDAFQAMSLTEQRSVLEGYFTKTGIKDIATRVSTRINALFDVNNYYNTNAWHKFWHGIGKRQMQREREIHRIGDPDWGLPEKNRTITSIGG